MRVILSYITYKFILPSSFSPPRILKTMPIANEQMAP